MCTNKIHRIITEDGPICGFDIKYVDEIARISGIKKATLHKRIDRLGKDKEIAVDNFLKPTRNLKIYRPRERSLTIAQQCRQAGVKPGTYARRKQMGATHNQALGVDFMLDRRYKLRYVSPNIKPNLYREKPRLFCYGAQFESFDEIAYVFDVNANRIKRLVKFGLSVEDAIKHRDARNSGLLSFSRLEKSEKLRNKAAKLYFAIIYVKGEKYLKMGYTTKNIDDRLKIITKYYKVIFHACDSLYKVFSAEQFIIEKILDLGYSSCELNFDGRSEIFGYSGRLENDIWDCLDLIFGRETVADYVDCIL